MGYPMVDPTGMPVWPLADGRSASRDSTDAPHPTSADVSPDQPWHVVGRLLNFGSPVLAAVLAVSSIKLLQAAGGGGMAAAELLFIGNAGIAVLGAAAGAALRSGRIGVRIGGAIAYGILALFVYGLIAGFLQVALA